MNARSALFDLYGDHLRSRGGRAPVAALVRLLAPLGVAAPAVRTAVSRMVRQGWLQPVRLDGGPGYALTPRAVRRLDDAATRIYRTQAHGWEGTWHLAVTSLPGERSRRDRLRAGMTFLGFAQLDDATWIGPRWSEEVDSLLESEGVRAERFAARHDGDSIGLVRRAWDVEGLGRAYARWLSDAESLVSTAGPDPDDETAFATRSRLVHEWRKFLFLDPGLPRSLLPDDWPGEKSAEFFDSESERLRPGATRFVDSCLTLTP
ncbi:MAG TPA: PaaX family transcriptional regulator C-terminal domain-containing protein [Actinomycetes bacterium]|nr:PaaX family transcriptional regulator C-terminal domain-containing protein [Actinomycetes bacterium]